MKKIAEFIISFYKLTAYLITLTVIAKKFYLRVTLCFNWSTKQRIIECLSLSLSFSFSLSQVSLLCLFSVSLYWARSDLQIYLIRLIPNCNSLPGRASVAKTDCF